MMRPGPEHYRAMDGIVYQVGRIALAFKRRADDGAEGAYSIVETSDPPEAAVGAHRHEGWEETFVVCAGSYAFEVEGRATTLGPGDSVFVPRGATHAYRSLGPDTGRLVLVSSPGGRFEAFVREATRTDPPADFRAVAAAHGIEFVR